MINGGMARKEELTGTPGGSEIKDKAEEQTKVS